eukprot:14936700-Alexandrium_andersonii.AAC.1
MSVPPIACGGQPLQVREGALEGGPLRPRATVHARLEVSRDVLASLQSARDVCSVPEPGVRGILNGPRYAKG